MTLWQQFAVPPCPQSCPSAVGHIQVPAACSARTARVASSPLPRPSHTQLRSTQSSVEHQSSSHEQQHMQGKAPGERAVLQLKQRLSECPVCGGTGRIACRDCQGQGYLPRGGYAKRNPLNMSRAVGSKWTAMVETLGWRHFRVIAVRKLDKYKHNTFLLLQASCDSSAQLWVHALTLRNRSCWAAGWLQMSELLGDAQGAAASSSSTGHKCHSCSGLGFKACLSCDGRGRTELVEVH